MSSAYGLINLFKPYDMMIRPYADYTECIQSYVTAEFGVGAAQAWNSEGKTSSPLTIWQNKQCGLEMLEGFPAQSKPTELLTSINANAADDRGKLCINADVHLDIAGAGVFRYFFLNELAVSVYLPFYRYRLTDLCIIDLTARNNPPSPQDFRVQTQLTDPTVFVPVVQEIGCFNIQTWERTGLGDITFFVDWQRIFPQAKPVLTAVMVAARLGLSAPSGKHEDTDLLFAFPFGNNGSWSIPFGFTLETTFINYIYAGFDIELTQIFGRSNAERIMTAHNQTDLILLQKGQMYRDPGIEQQYSVFFGLKNLPEGLNFRAVYQYRKHGNDVISPFDNCVNGAIASEALSLEESTLHQAIIRLDYDFSAIMEDPCVAPQLELFARIPFNGKRSVGNTTLGFAITVDY
jgi:hypothetical protein